MTDDIQCMICWDLGFVKFTDFSRPRPPFEFRQVCPKLCVASGKWQRVEFERDYPGMCIFRADAKPADHDADNEA